MKVIRIDQVNVGNLSSLGVSGMITHVMNIVNSANYFHILLLNTIKVNYDQSWMIDGKTAIFKIDGYNINAVQSRQKTQYLNVKLIRYRRS